MNLADVMEELATRLGTVPGLRAHGFPPDSVSPPAAWPRFPERIDYDSVYARGGDRITMDLLLVVGKVSDRASRDAISAYVNGSGASSVKRVLESGTFAAFDSVRVSSAEFDVVAVAGTDYLAAIFNLDIVGRGAD